MVSRSDPSAQTGVRLFLDSADRNAWEHWLPSGMFFGVTTNPTILEAAGLACRLPVIADLARAAFAHGIEELQVQTWGTNTAPLVRNGLALAALSPRIVVKVPVTFEGVRAVATLHREGVRTTLTAVYAPHQALTAAAAGASYVAPYFGRMGDLGRDALAEIVAMRSILAAAGRPTRLLIASIRSAADLASLAAAGLDTFTFGTRVAEGLFADPDTIKASAAFETAAAKGE